MKHNFLISTAPAQGAVATVFAAGAISPLDMLGEVEICLRSHGVRGNVLFDLLLAQGNKTNRYVYVSFDGQHFTTERIQSAQGEYQSLAPLSAKFLRTHLDEVDPSLLPKSMRFALRQGLPV